MARKPKKPLEVKTFTHDEATLVTDSLTAGEPRKEVRHARTYERASRRHLPEGESHAGT